MNKRLSTNCIKFGRKSAMICLFVALLLTIAGVTRWPIVLYAAAVLYFIAGVMICVGNQTQPSACETTIEGIDMTGWF